MTDQWTDRLSDYLDGELPQAERAELEAHLLHCAPCGAVLADLRRVVRRAEALEPQRPGRDLWPGIATRIGVTPPEGVGVAPLDRRRALTRRLSLSLPQLAAAGIALMLVSGGAAWLLHPAPSLQPPAQAPAPPVPPLGVPASIGPARSAKASYDAAVADLQRVLDQGRGRLDPATVQVIERNLAAIDSAIAQAQRAVAADSANLYLNSHLAETMRRKLELLRRAAALVSTVS
jgi:hypothetical protein